ncbi:MAG TPA: patatin-like phospholipase family protein [Terriglobia bacterium]|nr:patatin-like phospholipase family protein [Terriglobia bacterium]
MAYFILSCDGGGIRGLVTALLLDQLEKEFGIFQKVDLFAGTSTGGILALGLACGLPISRIIEIYSNEGSRIFQPFRTSELDALLARLRIAPRPHNADHQLNDIVERLWGNLDSLFNVKYNNTGLASILQGLFPAKPLASLRKVMVTTFQLESAEGWRPITINNLLSGEGGETLPVDAALSTGAAPTYFPPYQHPQLGFCIDGGVYANNPCSQALAVALQSGVQLSEITILSVGTGFSIQKMQTIPPPAIYGPLLWLLPFAVPPTPAVPLISVLLDGVGPADTFQCQQILGGRFMRADAPLPSFIPMDDYQSVSQLRGAAASYMNTSPHWQQVRTWAATMVSSKA